MRKALIVLFFSTSLLSHATTYYIGPSGNNNTGNGSISYPWASLAYACTKVTTPGDIIHVNPGTYTETSQSVLAVGISIEGAGNTSIIHSHITAPGIYTILLASNSEGTNGNQQISYIRMEGGLTAYSAIRVAARCNVKIHHCEFEDFFSEGVIFGGKTMSGSGEPTTYATGNEFYNNIITNCADYEGVGRYGIGCGNLGIGGQQGMLVHDNTMVQEDRGVDANGYVIKFHNSGYLKGLKIYNNTIIKPPYDGSTWDFSMELWNCRGGIEIYGNIIQGGVDFGGNTSITNDEGGYGFAIKVYNNTLGQETLRSTDEVGIHAERGHTGGFYVYNNIFKNLYCPLAMYQGDGDTFEDFYVFNNIFNTIGLAGTSNYGNGTEWGTIDVSNITYDNINFVNNVFYAGAAGGPNCGLRFTFKGTATNLTVRNNIFQGFAANPIYFEGSTINTVSIENNLYYNNFNSNSAAYSGCTITNKTEQNNKVGNPNFVSSSDFHLNAGSPGIGTGTPIQYITTDFENNPVTNPPNIGCYTTVGGLAYPVYVSSAIENATPSILEMTYNLTLASIVPAASAFSVRVNSVARTVNTVAISGTKVLLTLASPVVNGDVVTVTYTKPSTNPLQTASGGQAVTISAQTLTNKVNSLSLPAYVSSAIENATPAVLEMVYNLSLAGIVPAASAFTVQVNSVARTLNSVAISGTKVVLTLPSPVVNGDVVTVAYTKPATNPLQTTSGGQAVTISAQTVANKVNPVIPVNPVYVSSAIENATPARLEMNYNLSLANILPAVSAFSVSVNSVARTVNAVAVSGTKVLLTLASPIVYGDVVTVAYTRPATNPLQTASGGQAATISAQSVTNNVSFINTPPVVVINSPPSNLSGFVGEIDATGSYDINNDNLTYTWVVPNNVPVSSTSGSKIQFLSPIVNAPQRVEFTLKLSDGKTTQSKIVPVEILPYKPELEVAEVLNVEASGFQSPNYPHNILDGNIGTMWAVNGDNQWLILELKEHFNIQHVKLAFQLGQREESYFDILGSDDKVTWEPILTKSTSCAFSGDIQVFDFPPSKTGKEFNYVKLVGHSNSVDSWNYISEFRIFGHKHRNPTSYEEQPVKIYPNPAHEFINIKIDETTLKPDFIRIINFSGKIFFQDKVNPDIKDFQIPINLIQGIYIVQMGSGGFTLFTQKLIVSN